MESAGGVAILNIRSMAGDNKNVRMASYALSKAAANHRGIVLCSPALAWVSGQILTVSGAGVQELD